MKKFYCSECFSDNIYELNRIIEKPKNKVDFCKGGLLVNQYPLKIYIMYCRDCKETSVIKIQKSDCRYCTNKICAGY